MGFNSVFKKLSWLSGTPYSMNLFPEVRCDIFSYRIFNMNAMNFEHECHELQDPKS